MKPATPAELVKGLTKATEIHHRTHGPARRRLAEARAKAAAEAAARAEKAVGGGGGD